MTLIGESCVDGDVGAFLARSRAAAMAPYTLERAKRDRDARLALFAELMDYRRRSTKLLTIVHPTRRLKNRPRPEWRDPDMTVAYILRGPDR